MVDGGVAREVDEWCHLVTEESAVYGAGDFRGLLDQGLLVAFCGSSECVACGPNRAVDDCLS